MNDDVKKALSIFNSKERKEAEAAVAALLAGAGVAADALTRLASEAVNAIEAIVARSQSDNLGTVSRVNEVRVETVVE